MKSKSEKPQRRNYQTINTPTQKYKSIKRNLIWLRIPPYLQKKTLAV